MVGAMKCFLKCGLFFKGIFSSSFGSKKQDDNEEAIGYHLARQKMSAAAGSSQNCSTNQPGRTEAALTVAVVDCKWLKAMLRMNELVPRWSKCG
mmetsp:Transcript_27768/g.76432  ORF Transcript_27768/g.76432 Transcript_27768/m.76432 type:complete len:94 (-) Transcript_27768:10-291(-)